MNEQNERHIKIISNRGYHYAIPYGHFWEFTQEEITKLKETFPNSGLVGLFEVNESNEIILDEPFNFFVMLFFVFVEIRKLTPYYLDKSIIHKIGIHRIVKFEYPSREDAKWMGMDTPYYDPSIGRSSRDSFDQYGNQIYNEQLASINFEINTKLIGQFDKWCVPIPDKNLMRVARIVKKVKETLNTRTSVKGYNTFHITPKLDKDYYIILTKFLKNENMSIEYVELKSKTEIRVSRNKNPRIKWLVEVLNV